MLLGLSQPDFLVFVQEKAAEHLAGSDCAGGSLFVDPNPRPRGGGGGGRGDRGETSALCLYACPCQSAVVWILINEVHRRALPG